MDGVSYQYEAKQSIIAGCVHAVTLLKVLQWRAFNHISSLFTSVTPRVVVDDASMQWKGALPQKAIQLPRASARLFEAYAELKLVPQPNKSGYTCSSCKVAKVIKHHFT